MTSNCCLSQKKTRQNKTETVDDAGSRWRFHLKRFKAERCASFRGNAVFRSKQRRRHCCVRLEFTIEATTFLDTGIPPMIQNFTRYLSKPNLWYDSRALICQTVVPQTPQPFSNRQGQFDRCLLHQASKHVPIAKVHAKLKNIDTTKHTHHRSQLSPSPTQDSHTKHQAAPGGSLDRSTSARHAHNLADLEDNFLHNGLKDETNIPPPASKLKTRFA